MKKIHDIYIILLNSLIWIDEQEEEVWLIQMRHGHYIEGMSLGEKQ